MNLNVNKNLPIDSQSNLFNFFTNFVVIELYISGSNKQNSPTALHIQVIDDFTLSILDDVAMVIISFFIKLYPTNSLTSLILLVH